MSKNKERKRITRLIETVGSIIVVLGLILVSMLLLHDHAYKLFHYLFSTDGPADAYHFQWVGITVVVTGLGLFINDRQKKADKKEAQQRLKAQNSIDWMDEFRRLIAEFSIVVMEAQEANMKYHTVRVYKQLQEKRLDWLEESRKQRFEVEKIHRLLYLYTPQSDTTKELRKSIDAVFYKVKENIANISPTADEVLEGKKSIDEFTVMYKSRKKELQLLNENMIKLASQYLGHEWQQAIGELTGETKSNKQ